MMSMLQSYRKDSKTNLSEHYYHIYQLSSLRPDSNVNQMIPIQNNEP